jgi:peroxiredoxin
VRAARQHPDIEFVGVAGRDSTDAMDKFVDQYGIEFPNLVDDDGDIWRHFGVPGQPAWVFVTASGDVRKVIGSPSERELDLILDALATT